ncbi:MAG: exodeoxyribonuclease VII large subunit [Nitrososphaerales archaeon]
MTAEQEARLPGLLPGERSDAVSIATLYSRVQAALGRAFSRGRPLWVRGEIQSISDRTGHCYIELVDPDTARGRDAPVLKVNCWSRAWTPLKASMERQGVLLEPGTVITLQGRVELYPPRGQLNFIATDIDVTALLGRIAARRAALLRALETEGLLQHNKAFIVPAIPLRVGLVASRDTEGFRDFTGRLLASGFAFHIVHAPVHVQGGTAPRQIASAVAALCDAACDVVVLVRGGGSKGDLSVFDSEPVARSIAAASLPVWTGIGHTGDQSVADVVANAAFVTPTDCGNELVARVARWWDRIGELSTGLLERSSELVTDALRRDNEARARLCASARNQLDRHMERLHVRASRLCVAGPRCADGAIGCVAEHSGRIGRGALAVVRAQEGRVTAWRRLLTAYDVERQLERGYTITLGEDGRLVRSATQLAAGVKLMTRFKDGRARSDVTGVEVGRGASR